MNYKPIRSRKIYEEVSDALLDMVKTGQLKPGDRLSSVEQLAKNYDVSRSAVREALSGLRAMGIVEMRQGEGTYITQFDATKFSMPVATGLLMKREDIKELSEVRKILEVGAAGMAAMNYHEADLERMENALSMMEEGTGEIGDQADLEFHFAISSATHNQVLIHLMSSVSDIMYEHMRENRRLIFQSEAGRDALRKEHRLIYEAIKARDFDRAQRKMYDHLVNADKVVSSYID